MRELIEHIGFILKSSCSCGGTYRQTFKKNGSDFEIIIVPNRKRFEIRKFYKVVSSGKEEDFEQKLKENGII